MSTPFVWNVICLHWLKYKIQFLYRIRISQVTLANFSYHSFGMFEVIFHSKRSDFLFHSFTENIFNWEWMFVWVQLLSREVEHHSNGHLKESNCFDHTFWMTLSAFFSICVNRIHWVLNFTRNCWCFHILDSFEFDCFDLKYKESWKEKGKSKVYFEWDWAYHVMI